MFKLKKLVAAALAGVMMIAAAGCGGGADGGSSSSAANSGGKRVGVAMPTQSSQRWIQDGANMKEKLEALGYQVDLNFVKRGKNKHKSVRLL